MTRLAAGMATDSLLTCGGTFGDYEVVRRLGKGGMGEVYLVRDAKTGGEFAVKVMAERKHDARLRFAREAETAMKIRHPNLISVYEVGEDPETRLCFITMEYVTGGSVADRLAATGRLSPREAVAVVAQIASALEAAHQAGVIHRDIKPDNILFDGAGRPRLADLGIAKIVGESTTLTSADMIVGTPAYMSPEQMMDAHRADARSDIYSLGVVFYEMLAGRRPNAGASVVELLAKAIKGEELPDVRTVAPDVPAAIADVLSRMCASQPSARPASAREVVALLKEALAGALRPPVVRPRLARARRIRVRRLMSSTATNLAAAVAVGAVLFFLMSIPAKTEERVRKADDPPRVKAVVSAPPKVRPPSKVRPQPKPMQPAKFVELVKSAHSDKLAERVKSAQPAKPVEPSKPVEKAPPPPSVVAQPVGDHVWDCRPDGFGVAVTGVRPAAGRLTIPSTMTIDGETLEVTAIGERAFLDCREIVSITVPESVTHIGDEAFAGCSGLRSVVFRGDAPEAGRNVFKRTRIDLLVRVAADGTGWNGLATTDLPERWPMGAATARAIYHFKDGDARLEESPQYCEIDISSGPDASHYDVSWHRRAPAKGWSNKYRTDRIVLRRVAPAGEAQAGEFYIGIFEVTREQVENVMGDSDIPWTTDRFIEHLATRAGLETLGVASAAQLKRAGCAPMKRDSYRLVADVLGREM